MLPAETAIPKRSKKMPKTHYIWDMVNDSYLMEKDQTGDTTAVYTSEPVQYGKLISTRRGADKEYFHFDGLGSTTALTDEDGNVTAEKNYTAFGEQLPPHGTTINPFGFIGRFGYHTDSPLTRIDARQRTYNPFISRWMTQDPAGLQNLGNRFSYCLNNPVSRIDPTGRITSSLGHDSWAGDAGSTVPYYSCEYMRAVVYTQMHDWRKLGFDLAADLLELFLNDGSKIRHVIDTKRCGSLTGNAIAMEAVRDKLKYKCSPPSCSGGGAVKGEYRLELLPRWRLALDILDMKWDDISDLAYASGTGTYSYTGTLNCANKGCCCRFRFGGTLTVTDTYYFYADWWRLKDSVYQAGNWLLDEKNGCLNAQGRPYVQPEWQLTCPVTLFGMNCTSSVDIYWPIW
jgi:RHS repeat-associated protein